MNWGENIAIKYALFKGDLVIFTACPMYRIRMKMMHSTPMYTIPGQEEKNVIYRIYS